MSEQSVLRSPQVVARELDISPATLRRWSEEFKEHLSEDANAGTGRSHRRYKDADLHMLLAVKTLMNDGLTYEQVREKLNSRDYPVAVEPDQIEPEPQIEFDEPQFSAENLDSPLPNFDSLADDSGPPGTALINPDDESPAIAFLTNTLATLSDSQKSILNSQAANRELLGVLLQDNFNLKEENNRLRERILEVERDVSQSRQDEEWRREALRQELEAKINAASQMASTALNTANTIEVPEIKAVESKPGCLGSIFGGGAPQFVTVPRRRIAASAGPAAAPRPSGPVSPAGPSPASHPKPMFPPE